MTINHDKNGLFVLGGPETQLHDILWAVQTKKTMVEVRARKISGSSQLRLVVGGRAMRVSLVHVCACVRGVGLTEPQRGVELYLNPSDCTSYVTEPE